MDSRLPLAPCTSGDFHKPLAELLLGAKILRLGGRSSSTSPYWVVTGRLEKRALMGLAVPFEQVWTLAELGSASVPLTLGGFMRAFGFSLEERD
jgi:hypothetical protein